jgi:glycosyltransferase involved in cell wall biosynthesis
MNEKISVIIPLYNKEKEIKRALDSVLCQTFQNFEVIVVDDHSSDQGPAIVKSFHDPRISFIGQEHRGVSYTRNHGVNLASSDFVAFLDADDEWMPKHLETLQRLIQDYPEAGMFTTACKIQPVEGKLRWANYKYIPNPPWEGLLPDYFKSGALGFYPVVVSVVAIPKKIYHEMGGFPEGYWMGEDVDLFSRIALKYPVAFSWEFGAIYHWDASNRACDKRIPPDYVEPFVKTARAALIRGAIPKELTESLNEYIWKLEILRASHYVKTGNSDSAQIILKQCNTKWQYNEKMKWLLLAKFPYSLFHFIQDMRRKIIKMVRKSS